ncbi:DUF1028 domain-containing protein [Haloplanus salilacus]|uniref:DUF1028 domain-containing protein n=1 Tax=Haloplanus salilacus TaxID=2949994 RepID=UPI0030CFE019
MTYSICARDRLEDGPDGAYRFGVAAAARLPAVGSVATHASEDGAVATAGVTDADVGRRCLDALADGRSLSDALGDAAAPRRQVHGVDAANVDGHTGDDCRAVAGHVADERYGVAGTSLSDEAVLEAVSRAFRENERDAPLAVRLLTALAAGERAGGDRRELPTGSAAVAVRRTDGATTLYDDLRVDASDAPIADLRETYRRAKRGYERAVERYADDQTENS